MINWSLLFYGALTCGLALALVLTTIMVISGAIAPDMWVGDYPPDIKEKFGPMSPRAVRIRPFFAVLFFAVILVIPILGLSALSARVEYLPFLIAYTFSLIVLLVFNVYDLLVLDWLFFCTIQPRIMVLPGTEGMPAYRDYRFHFIGFLKGLAFCAVGSLVVTSLWVVLQLIVK
jgi:hypothetical protein